MAREPSPADVCAFLDAGHTQIEAAQRFGLSRQKVQRLEKSGRSEDGPGPTERAARGKVAETSGMDGLLAESLIGLAVIADIGRGPRANGAERTAGVAAYKELLAQLAEIGQASGFEELRDALLAA